jgi:hypothetical protein
MVWYPGTYYGGTEETRINTVPRCRYLLGLQTTPLNLSHSLFPTSPSVLQSSITDSSHTNCVDYRTLTCHADSRTVPYSWRSWLSTDLLCSEAGCRLKASGSLPDCKLSATTALTNSASLTLPLVTVGVQPQVAFFGPSRSHLAKPFRNALSRFGYRGEVCGPFTMHSGLWLTVACMKRWNS